MLTPDDDSPSSSLPKSLRQHLYSGPRQPLDSSPHSPLPPLVPPPLPAVVTPDRLPPSSSASLLDLAGAAVNQTTIPTQRPVYSDPVFHTSRSSSLSRIINHSVPHLSTIEDPHARRHSWREGEAGPSTLGRPSRTRDAASWRMNLRPKHEPMPPLSLRSELSWQEGRNSLPGADPRSTLFHHGSLRNQDQLGWDGRQHRVSPSPHEGKTLGERVSSPLFETQGDPKFQRPFNLTRNHSSPDRITSSPSGSTRLYASQFHASDQHIPLRYFSPSTSRGSYVLPAPPSNSPSPAAVQLRASPRLATSHSDAHNPNTTRSDASSHQHAQKRTKTPVACEFCRGRKLKCDGDRPRCKNCYERRFECRYPTFQRRRGPGKAPKGSRPRKRAVAGASTFISNESAEARMSGEHYQPHTQQQQPSRPLHELEALAPEVRQYASVMNLDRYTFEPPPQYPPLQIPQPPASSSWRPRSRETSSEDRSDAKGIRDR